MTAVQHYLGVAQVEGHDALSITQMISAALNEHARRTRGGSLPASAVQLVDVAGLGPCVVVLDPAAKPPTPPADDGAADVLPAGDYAVRATPLTLARHR
jgi:sugar (pentulose or hexulose) kinase